MERSSIRRTKGNNKKQPRHSSRSAGSQGVGISWLIRMVFPPKLQLRPPSATYLHGVLKRKAGERGTHTHTRVHTQTWSHTYAHCVLGLLGDVARIAQQTALPAQHRVAGRNYGGSRFQEANLWHYLNLLFPLSRSRPPHWPDLA